MSNDEVTLIHPVIGELTTDSDHAQRILALRNSGGWALKNDGVDQSNESKSDAENGTTNREPNEPAQKPGKARKGK